MNEGFCIQNLNARSNKACNGTNLVTGFSNPPRLEALNYAAMAAAKSVKAAVACVTDERTLIESCMSLGVKLTLWARYDFSMPISVTVLQKFLDKGSPDFSIRIVPDGWQR
jgi:hypothetical protein